jgi:radical SAM superfamily enzyme YgiQ (UPF0313 family)
MHIFLLNAIRVYSDSGRENPTTESNMVLHQTRAREVVGMHPAIVLGQTGFKARDISGLTVVLINMPLREKATPNTTPEGPLLLATNLRMNYGVSATVIDLNAYRIVDEKATRQGLPNGRHLTEGEVRALITRHFDRHGTPDIVGLSGKITTLRWQRIVTKIVRSIVSDTFLVSGNGLATELKAGLFNYIPELDAVAHSEGDDVILKICLDAKLIKDMGWRRAVNSGKLMPYYMGHDGIRHRFLYAGGRPKNLNLLPFADLEILREDVFGNPLLEWYLKQPVWGVGARNSSATPFNMLRSTTSVSSRGCPFACKYCFRGSQGERDWGVRSPEHICTECLHHVEKYGIDFHGFPDDNFAVRTDRIQALIPLLGPLAEMGIHWGTHTRNDEGADRDKIEAMAKAGCIYIGFGPESANEETLIALGKGGQTLKQGFEIINIHGQKYRFPRAITDSIRNCVEFGIHANCTWIMGSPTETLARLKYTIALMLWQIEYYGLNDIPAEAVNLMLFVLTYYPGTQLSEYQKVRDMLSQVFGLNFYETGRKTSPYEPVCDAAYEQYLLNLDDATKLLYGPNGEPLNFSSMPNETFERARELVDSGRTLEILDMTE